MARIGSLSCAVRVDTVTRVNVAPPSVERTATIEPESAFSLSYSPATTTSVPSARTTGWVPTSVDVERTGVDHVSPPSLLNWLTVEFWSSSVYSA